MLKMLRPAISEYHFFKVNTYSLILLFFGIRFALYARKLLYRPRQFRSGNETSTSSFPGTNFHCVVTVVVSFPGTKVHGNETSIIL